MRGLSCMRASPAALGALLLGVGPLWLVAFAVVVELFAQEVTEIGLHADNRHVPCIVSKQKTKLKNMLISGHRRMS
jgi:hypothetical protein